MAGAAIGLEKEERHMSTKTKNYAVVAIVALALVIGGCMSAQHRSAGRVIDDATITATVKTKLAADTRVSALDIDVDTKSGVVTLSGHVPDSTARSAALDIARTVEGVASVRDMLTIKG